MTVKLRKGDNSFTLAVPAGITTLRTKYDVKNANGNLVFIPAKHHKNIFATPAWTNYDYQAAIANDPALQEIQPVGHEILD